MTPSRTEKAVPSNADQLAKQIRMAYWLAIVGGVILVANFMVMLYMAIAIYNLDKNYTALAGANKQVAEWLRQGNTNEH